MNKEIEQTNDEAPALSADVSTTAVETDHKPPFPIVGIGASAGGLAAFESFLTAIPKGQPTGMAFVLIQHLAPDHKSILSNIVQEYTDMTVYEIENGMVVMPDTVYIIPPNWDLALFEGKLHLFEPAQPRHTRLAIDFFFRSLAQDQHERAICIVLSGTGTDGTLGMRSVKGSGGMAMVQTPESAEYDGMPRSAIATNLADFVLPPQEMPAQLFAYISHAFGRLPIPSSPAQPKPKDALQKIFILLRNQTNHDFAQYKINTVLRRIERRMAVQQIDDIYDYVRFLQTTPSEVVTLFHDLLIGVTHFFRDPEAFTALETEAIPRLFANRQANATIRVWVPGCSTGEEAYSIAILLQEKMEAIKQSFKVQLFATDIDSYAISVARAGTYPASIAVDVSPERLARFFNLSSDGTVYHIRKSIRDMVIFSEQNLIQDPPFSRLDLISCRNLLIYLDAALQRKLIPLFHYALVPGGLLFLGNSETVGEFGSLFATLDRKWKLYQSKDKGMAGLSTFDFGSLAKTRPMVASASRVVVKENTLDRLPLRELTERALLKAYAPSSLLVNALGDILYIHGRTGKYLEPSPGEAGMNMLSMAREGLRRKLTVALHRAVAEMTPVFYSNIWFKNNGSSSIVDLAIRPATGDASVALFLVTLAEVVTVPQEPAVVESSTLPPNEQLPADVVARITELERALQAKEEYLQATLEEMDTANEELKSANEELQSVNEELQSTNEELETSKEELQSVNEELATVNAELQEKVADLSQANNDMNNLLAGTGVGTIFIDHDLRILRFTPAATQIINLIEADIGRPVSHIVSNLDSYDHLVADVKEVLANLTPKEVEVRTISGAWYLLNIRPYRTLKNVIEGAVITFVNITRTKQAESSLRLAAVVADASDAITMQDLQGRILAWNPAAVKLYGWTEAEALQLSLTDRIPLSKQLEELVVLKQISHFEKVPAYATERVTKHGRVIDVMVTATALINSQQDVYAIATTERLIPSPLHK